MDPVDTLGYALAQLYGSFEDAELRREAAEEWARALGHARSADEAALTALFAFICRMPWG